MKINTHLAIILAALTGVTASVQAQDAAPANPPELSPAHKLKPFEKEFDANHDGKLDPTEKAAMVSKYDRMGMVSLIKRSCPPRSPIRTEQKKTGRQIRRRSNLSLLLIRDGWFRVWPRSPVLFWEKEG